MAYKIPQIGQMQLSNEALELDRANMLQAFGFGKGAGKAVGEAVKNGADEAAGKLGENLTKAGGFSNTMKNIGAGVGAAVGLGTFGMDIYNTVMNQRAAKEQLDLTKKNWNLELEKAQKQEYANNKLAASVDKAWGGDGKIENTIDYSKYKATDSGYFMGGDGEEDLGGSSLKDGGLGGDYIKDTTQNTANNELSGSGNTPMMSSPSNNMLQPVGYSESINTNNTDNTDTTTQDSDEAQG